MKMLLGDIHGNFSLLQGVLKQHPEWESVTIVGDVGIGFGNTSKEKPPFEAPIPINFIRGNHDNPDFIRNLSPGWSDAGWNYIPDGAIVDGILYIGGAYSIDKDARTPGYNWWPEEELNRREQDEILEKLGRHEGMIHTVITHDCPHYIYPALHPRYHPYTETSVFLNSVLNVLAARERLRPLRWFYGHHHKTHTMNLFGIRFKCIDELHYERL